MPRERERESHARRKKPVAWLTLLVPIEISDRLAKVIETANARRAVDQRLVSKSGFCVAAIADAISESEKGLGIG